MITGASGFAGSHLVRACADAGDEVIAIGGRTAVDLRDPQSTRTAVADARPEVIYHLAALAHVGRSWQDPATTLADNQALAVSVLEAVRAEAPEALVIFVSSGEVYGPPAALPVTEDAPLRPQNPYAVSKAAGDLLAGFYADAHGLMIARARAFNHSGPGQSPIYAIAAFARQVAAGMARGDTPIPVVTGSPDTRRDYTDVRDVVRAYRMLAQAGRPGIYNVCSGETASARELVTGLGVAAGLPIAHDVDPALVRAHEVKEVRGSSQRLAEICGWKPEIPLAVTLADTLAWWQTTGLAERA